MGEGGTSEWTVSVHADEDGTALAAARVVRDVAEGAISRSGVFNFAVSGGRTPWLMFAHLSSMNMPWSHTRIFQVDERIAPADDPARNLRNLQHSIDGAPARIFPMPVEERPLIAAAKEYERLLPLRFDLIHLGLGSDGHTASLIPGDPILDVVDTGVSITTHPYQGHQRMSMTYPTLNSALAIVWLVTGAQKSSALRQLLAHDRAIPAGRVHAGVNLVICDEAAESGVVNTT